MQPDPVAYVTGYSFAWFVSMARDRSGAAYP